MNIKHMNQDEINYWIEHGSHKNKWAARVIAVSIVVSSASVAVFVLNLFGI